MKRYFDHKTKTTYQVYVRFQHKYGNNVCSFVLKCEINPFSRFYFMGEKLPDLILQRGNIVSYNFHFVIFIMF